MALLASPPPAPADAELPANACALLRHCAVPAPGCAPAAAGAEPRFGDGRCLDVAELAGRGVDWRTATGRQVLVFLSRRYQVVYALEGYAPLSPQRLGFLVDDFPFAARLLSHFQSTPYSAEYLGPDRRRFRGSRGGQLSGEAELLSGSTTEGRLFYVGQGTSSLAFLRLRGQGLLRVEYAPARRAGGGTDYKVRVVVSPANPVINAIMTMGFFRSVVQRHIRDVLKDMTEASAKLARAKGPPGHWAPAERDKVSRLLQLP